MSIYHPVSSVSNSLLGVGGSILSGAATALGGKLGQAIGGEFGQNIGSAIAGNLANEALKNIGSKVQNWAYDADDNLHAKLDYLFKNGQLGDGALNLAGGLSFKDMWEIYHEADVDNLSRKNFYVLEINDRSESPPTARDGNKYSQFNLLTTSLSFNQTIINSETIPLGSVEVDKPQSSARTEMQLSVMDDKWGSIKRWAKRKALSVAQSDGTFLPPYYYLFDVRVVFGTNVALKQYYSETYTMRLAEVMHELGRRDQGLEEIQLKFVQWDTCMPSTIL